MRRSATPLLLACLTFGLIASAPGAIAAPGDIYPVAGDGTGIFGFSGDGGPATAAMMHLPSDAAPLPGGGYLIADKKNARIRRVSPNGTIRTVAGTTVAGYNGDGIKATDAQLQLPTGVTPLGNGAFLIADSGNNRVRRVSAAGMIKTVAGTGTQGYNGDGIRATNAELSYPARVALTRDGGFLIADFYNNRIRKVTASGKIRTVAGNGTAGGSGDGGPATAAELDQPSTAVPTADGGFLISEFTGHRIRKVTASGKIKTVAGTGTLGFNGDGIQAKTALLNQPTDAEPTIDGGFLIADYENSRVRKVSPTGVITTVAGNGTPDNTGDGGPATAATVNHPTSARPMPDGGFVLTDFFNHRVRRVAGADAPASCGARSFNVIVGSRAANRLIGSKRADAVLGRGGRDGLFGKGSGDCLRGGKGADRLSGGRGRDLLAGGPGRDVLLCGKGVDTAIAGPSDVVSPSCERVR